MADFDLSTVTAALSQNYRDVVVRTFNSTSIGLRVLRFEQGEGKNAAWDWEATGAIGENFSDGADVSNYGIDTPAPATLGWGLYRSNWKMSNLARAAARRSRSPLDMLRPMGRSLENAARKLASTLNGVMYNGAGTGTTIAGLGVALADANTYGGVDRTQVANAQFRAKVIDPGVLTDPTVQLIRSDLFAIRDLCGEMPDVALCPSAVFLKLAALFDPLRRFDQAITVDLPKGSVVLDASVGKIVVEGCVFICDKDATAQQVQYLNTNYVWWQFLPPADDEMLVEDMMVAGMQDTLGGLPLGMNVYSLARTGAARKFSAEVQAQLVVSKPNACGVRKNIKDT